MAGKSTQDNLLSVTITKKINDMIIHENMKPGTKLPNEKQLAELYSVSRSTIREAFKALKAQNIVVIRQGDGTYVSDNTGRAEDPLGFRYLKKEKLIEDIFEARLLIEPQIAMLAAERATRDEILELKQIADKMQKTSFMSDDRMNLDIQFHTLIAACSRNAVFNQLIPVIYETIEKGVVILHDHERSHKRAQHAHMDIYLAIANREPWKVKNAVSSHIYNSLEDIKLLDKGDGLG
ncbi:MAG TPA: FadR family transcriptional regulator [Clostridiales bacterium]|nr:FadR family transcriptional regulator [Clostridiales bacterium]